MKTQDVYTIDGRTYRIKRIFITDEQSMIDKLVTMIKIKIEEEIAKKKTQGG